MLAAMMPAETLRRALHAPRRGEAIALVREALERRTPLVSLAAAHVLFARRAHDEALAEVRRARLDPRLTSRALATELEWLLRLGRLRETRDAMADFDATQPHARYHAAFADALANHGCDARALREIDHALRLAPDSASALIFRARICAQLRRHDDVLSDLRRAVELRPEPSLLAEAATIAMADGSVEVAQDYRERSGITEPEAREPYEQEVLRAEALYTRGAFDEALAAADRAIGLARAPLIPALALQHLCRIAVGRFRGGWPAFGELGPALVAVFPELSIEEILNDVPATERVLRQLLVELRNRTTTPTIVRDGVVVALRLDDGARFASRRALQRIVGDDDDEVLAALSDAMVRYPHSQLPRAHRGELRSWLGDYRGARDDLESVIRQEPRTRWPYIGMTAVEMLDGNPQAALDVCALGIKVMGGEGPAVYVHRGEANRRLGRFADAEADLSRARELHPRRLSAAINLALLHLATARASTSLVGDVTESAPGLISDAEAQTGLTIDDHPIEVLERALAMMRGNRSSSCITYHHDGHLRSVVLGGGDAERKRDRERAVELVERLR